MTSRGPRVAFVGGCRTPFAKAGGFLANESALDLARTVVAEIVPRAALRSSEVDRVVLGIVVANPSISNLAREATLAAGLPPTVEAFTVSRACASANQAIASAVEAIQTDQAATVIAGGAESLSNVPITVSRPLARALLGASKARTFSKKLRAFSSLRAKDLLPSAPAIAEYSTGLTMGQSAEKMAKENGVSRESQDRFALQSHERASAATTDGRLPAEIVRYYRAPGYDASLAEDDGIRRDTDLAALASLRPVFDRRYGSITAGNSSPLTDGAAALVLMKEDKARAEGRTILGYVRSYAFAGVDPFDQLLIGPVYSTAIALERAGLTLGDMLLVDLHEAFAAQVLSVLGAFASTRFCREKLGRATPLGEVDPERLNVLGGSIALGHPFGATGARITLSVLNELRRRGGGF
ncbi:MAG TPA: acetyl-CoA C-acyltransferase, partial [Vicinamibacteria bacterium]|nr:acetyl-CoA C-acyltransferase [Vicinamibacteria bacterium]